MKIAISNIAWDRADDEPVSRLMREYGLQGVEIAPTKVWPAPLEATDSEVRACREFWESRRTQIVALQSILFGRPDLMLFGDHQTREQTFAYLVGMIQLGGRLGVKICVFGSPKNRVRGALGPDAAAEIAVPFFRRLGEAALENGLVFCIEPNPTAYGCDYVTTSAEGLELVRRVNCPGFGLHLDAGGMTSSREDVAVALSQASPALQHFHVSEFGLVPIGAGTVDHGIFAAALRDIRYEGWLSIEMRALEGGDGLARIRDSLSIVTTTYRGSQGGGQPGSM